MPNVKVQTKSKFQRSNEKYFDILAFDIPLKFGFWYLEFWFFNYVR